MSTVKISDLTSIGAVQGNVLLPMVGNVAGTLTTLRGNIDQIGTYLLADVLVDIGALESNVSTLQSNAASQQTQIHLSNVTLKDYVDGQITAANAGVTAANVGLKGYVDAQILAVEQGEYSNVNVAVYLPTYAGTIGSLTTANTSMKSYVDGQITAANSAVTTANIGMIGYVDNKVLTANVGMKGYVDAQTYSNVNVTSFLPSYTTGDIGQINIDPALITIDSPVLIQSNLSVLGSVFLANVLVPTLANSTGTTGQVTWDSNYLYVCVNTNTWRRANLSAW